MEDTLSQWKGNGTFYLSGCKPLKEGAWCPGWGTALGGLGGGWELEPEPRTAQVPGWENDGTDAWWNTCAGIKTSEACADIETLPKHDEWRNQDAEWCIHRADEELEVCGHTDDTWASRNSSQCCLERDWSCTWLSLFICTFLSCLTIVSSSQCS